jgi:lipoprotein-anchoring transpeptidase ErfK/SrfK
LAHELADVAQQGGETAPALHRQEDQTDATPVDVEEEGPVAAEDEDVEDGDTDVDGLDFTPGLDMEPHGPEPQATEETAFRQDDGSEPLGFLPTDKITHIDVDQVSQRMTLSFKGGQKQARVVSTGKGNCGTSGDPCPTQKERHCTPNGTLTLVSRGNAKTKNSNGDAMAWFVGMNIPGRKGIGIHDSQIADGTPRSHGCVRVGISKADEAFAKLINQSVIIGTTTITISGKAKTKAYPCPQKKKKP